MVWVYIWHEELPKSLVVLPIVLLVVKHVKVVFILYNSCTCTHDIVQAAAWCTLTIVSTCLGSCETWPMVEKRASLLESAAPKREKFETMDYQTSAASQCSLVPGLFPRKRGRTWVRGYSGLQLTKLSGYQTIIIALYPGWVQGYNYGLVYILE